jgi:adenine-specific DNA-methyltransferase
MWSLLRRRQLQELRFRRQQPIGPYIVDFFCPAAKLIVELDGGQHGEDEAVIYDLARTEWLEAQGYRVLRFWNLDFLKNPEVVLEGIWRAILESGTPLPEALRAPLPEALRASTLPQGEG